MGILGPSPDELRARIMQMAQPMGVGLETEDERRKRRAAEQVRKALEDQIVANSQPMMRSPWQTAGAAPAAVVATAEGVEEERAKIGVPWNPSQLTAGVTEQVPLTMNLTPMGERIFGANAQEDTVSPESVAGAQEAAERDPRAKQYELDRLKEIKTTPSEAINLPETEIDVAGLTIDQQGEDSFNTTEVVNRLADEDKLLQIRAEARMKGRMGSLSHEDMDPSIYDFLPEGPAGDPAKVTGGSFSQQAMTPEIQKRLDDNMLYAAQSDEQFASWMLQTPEIRERMKWDPSAIGEGLRRISEQQTEDARKTLGMRLIELGTGPSGKMSPETASAYQIWTGEAPPDGIVGISRLDAAQEIFSMRNRLDMLVNQAGFGQSAIMNDYRRQAVPMFRRAQAALEAGADPDMVVQRLAAEVSALEGRTGVGQQQENQKSIDQMSVRGASPYGSVGVASRERNVGR